MALTIGQPGPAADTAGSGSAPSTAAAGVAQAQSAQSADIAALFGSLGLGTNADAFA